MEQHHSTTIFLYIAIGVKTMMKSILAIILLVATIFALASCVPDTPDPPEGVWISENPRITLFFKSEYRIPTGTPTFIGLYAADGIETRVVVPFGNGLRFEIHDYTMLRETGAVMRGSALLTGTYRVTGNEIHWSSANFLDRIGVSTVIFRRVEDYEPIDPYYWSPYFFPRASVDETAP